jgi:NTP pyrophosphatase (non-canonical NTP hydrolase)
MTRSEQPPGITLDEYQHSALHTANRALSPDERLLDAAAGLAEEAGEVLGLVRKRAFQGRDASRDRFVEELGDLLWCLAMTADCLGVSLGEIGKANLDKLARRHPAGFRAHETR